MERAITLVVFALIAFYIGAIFLQISNGDKPVKLTLAPVHCALPAGHTNHELGDCAPHSLKQRLRLGRVLRGETGPDLSNNDPVYQGQFSIRRAGHTFEWVKVVEGTGFVDRTAGAMAYWAHKAGVQIGGYDFAHVCDNPASEADSFVYWLRQDHLLRGDSLRPVLDAEYGGSGCSTIGWVSSWIREVERLTGVTPGVYTGGWWWTPHAGCWQPPVAFNWISGYPSASTPCGMHGVDVHQYTDHGWNGAIFSDMSVLNVPPEQIAQPVPVPAIVTSRCAWLGYYLHRQNVLHSHGQQLGHYGRHEIKHHRKYLADHRWRCNAGRVTGRT